MIAMSTITRAADDQALATPAIWRDEVIGIDELSSVLGGLPVRYVNLDNAATTPALRCVLEAVTELLPRYSSVHRGAGWKSQQSTIAYEDAREAVLAFAGRGGRDDVAILVRNTTEAINHLAYRLRLAPVEEDDGEVLTLLFDRRWAAFLAVTATDGARA